MARITSTRIDSGIHDTRSPGPTPAADGARWPAEAILTTDEALTLLRDARIGLVGRLVDASNATFYCLLGPTDPEADEADDALTADDPGGAHAVYKPIDGERPLDDFPDRTLAHREVAAWLVSEASGLGIVPPTVLRDGPLGRGMLQLWIDVDPDADPLMLVLTRDPRLRPIALLDLVLNNADRKGGHLLASTVGTILGCDHGICFASEPKLRTVLWAWSGEPFDDADRSALTATATSLDGGLADELEGLLSRVEVDATRRRLDALIRLDRFPTPDRGRRAIPWPPF